jgi:hypothetical protein
MEKSIRLFCVLFVLFACQKESSKKEFSQKYSVEISFDSVMCYQKDTSISLGMTFIYATTKNFTEDTLSLKVSERGYFSRKNHNFIAKYDSMNIPVEICSGEGILYLLPKETTFSYYYNVDFGDFMLDYEKKHGKYFVFSKGFFDKFFQNCTFYVKDTTLKINLLRNPNFKVLYLENVKNINNTICSPM